ncbi:MAG: hypothetical protein ACOYXB_06490 [Bacteroidota bacterium]
MKTDLALTVILLGGLLFSCSELSRRERQECFDAFFAGSVDCGAKYLDTSGEPTLQTDALRFDLNGDQETDLTFQPSLAASPYRDWETFPQTTFYLGVKVIPGSGCEICVNEEGLPDTLSYGQAFSSCENWDCSGTDYRLSYYESIAEFDEITGPGGRIVTEGLFYNVQDKYLLCRVVDQADTTLAWFCISCSETGYVRIGGYACISSY